MLKRFDVLRNQLKESQQLIASHEYKRELSKWKTGEYVYSKNYYLTKVGWIVHEIQEFEVYANQRILRELKSSKIHTFSQDDKLMVYLKGLSTEEQNLFYRDVAYK